MKDVTLRKEGVQVLVISTVILLTAFNVYSIPTASGTYASGFFVEGFNTQLNLTTWKYANYSTAYASLRPEYVSVSHSLLHITIPGGQRVGGQIETRSLFGHCVFGIRFRASVSPTSNSGFCTYFKNASMAGCDQIAMEVFGSMPTKLSCGMWKDGKRQRNMIDLGFNATQGFHDYECAWFTDRVEFFVDAKLVTTLADITCVPTRDQRLILGAFCCGSGFWEPPSNMNSRADFAAAWISRRLPTSSTNGTSKAAVLEKSIASTLASTPASNVIDPQTGQYANYNYTKYFTSGTIYSRGWWNTTHTDLTENLVNVTHQIVRRYASNGTYWLTVDKTNRWVTAGTSWWAYSWFIGWIPPNETIGSRINWWMIKAKVVGTYNLTIDGQNVETWLVDGTYPDSPYPNHAYYSKNSGLLVNLTSQQNNLITSLILTDTNIPI